MTSSVPSPPPTDPKTEALSQLVSRAMSLAGGYLERIMVMVRAATQRTRSVDGAVADAAAAFQTRSEAQAKVMQGRLEAQQQRLHELKARIALSAPATRASQASLSGLQRTSVLLEGISLESRLLSVNAKVQAANLAGESRSIQVIATAIRDLSVSLARCADELEQTTTQAKEAVPTLSGLLEDASSDSDRIIDEMDVVIKEYAAHRASLERELNLTFEQSREHHERSVLESHDTLAAMQGFDEVMQLLNAVLIRLDCGHEDTSLATPKRFLTDHPFEDEEEDTSDGVIFFF